MRLEVLAILTCLAAAAAWHPLQAQKGPTRGETAGMAPRSAAMGGARAGQGIPGSRAAGFAFEARPLTLQPPLTNRLLFPGALPRCGALPDSALWKNRDLMREIRYLARRGFIPVEPAGDVPEFQGVALFPAGWKAYGFVVPGGEKLHVRLHHPNEGWFRLAMVDRWGQIREGMLQNLIPTGNPEVSYKSPLKEATTVYVIVDDPGWMSTNGNPFTIKVDRTWDPGKAKTPALPPVLGIWAQAKPAEPAPAKDAKPAA